jgi:hypothetical protein
MIHRFLLLVPPTVGPRVGPTVVSRWDEQP